MGKKRDRIRVVYCSIGGDYGGGIERMESYYYNHLDRDRFDPVFVVTTGSQVDRNPYDNNIPYITLDFSNRFHGLLEVIADADIVQFNGGLNPLVCEAARLSGVPVLIEIMHYTEPGQVYPWIDMTVCVSEMVQGVQPFPERTLVIHNGIDLEEFPFRREKKKDKKRIVLLEVSRREKEKHYHLDELANDILSIDPAIEIWLAGRNQVGQSTERVKFLGLKRDVLSLYHEAALFLLLSKREPFGLVVLEAMASGCIPLVSDDGGAAEIVTDGVDGWVVPAYDKGAVLRGISNAIELYGSAKWKEMRYAARRTVEKRFRADDCVKRYEQLYFQLIDLKGRRKVEGGMSFEPPPEIDTDDGLAYFRAGRWGDMVDTLRKMAGRKETFRAELLAVVAERLARLAMLHGERDIGIGVLRKLCESGFRKIIPVQEWLKACDDEALMNLLVQGSSPLGDGGVDRVVDSPLC